MAARAPQSRNWVFTRQVTEQEERLFTRHRVFDLMPECGHPYLWHTNDACSFTVFQLEKAPSTGQLHIQGFIHFKSSRKMSFVKNLIGNEPHCEVAHDVPASILYCQKSDTRIKGPWKYGYRLILLLALIT